MGGGSVAPASPLPPPLPWPRKAGNEWRPVCPEDAEVTWGHGSDRVAQNLRTQVLHVHTCPHPCFQIPFSLFYFFEAMASYHLLTDCECPAGLVFMQIEPEERRQGKRNEKTNGEDEGWERRCPPCPPRSRKTRDEQEVSGQGPRSLGVRTGVKSLSPTIAFPLRRDVVVTVSTVSNNHSYYDLGFIFPPIIHSFFLYHFYS